MNARIKHEIAHINRVLDPSGRDFRPWWQRLADWFGL